MNGACCTQETAVQLLVVPIKSEILTMVTADLSCVERGSGFLGKIASWEGRGCSQQVAEGWRMLLCGKGERYSAHAAGSFVLFVHVFVASVPESSGLLNVTDYGANTMCRTVFPSYKCTTY